MVFVHDATKELLDGGVPTEAILIALAHKFHISESVAKKIVDDVKVGKIVSKEGKIADDIAPAKRESDTIVLGKTKDPNYGDVAAENGYRNFDIPAEQWNKMTSVERWEANQKFLDRAISKGDNIVLSHNPNDPTVYTGYFKQEIEYLKSKGYSVSPDGQSMIPPSY